MKKKLLIHVRVKEGDGLAYGPAFPRPEFEACFKKACDMGLSREDVLPIHRRSTFTVSGYKNHSPIGEFIEWLKSLGCKAHDGIADRRLPEDVFEVHVDNEFDPQDIDHDGPVVMQGFSVEGGVELLNREPGRLLGQAASIEDYDHPEDSDPWKARAVGAESYGEFAISEGFKRELEGQSFVGLGFEEIEWADPENARGRFWLARSCVTMPPTLTPVAKLSQLQEMYDYAETDGGRPARLVYRRSEFEQLGRFDFGVTRERLGTRGRPRVAEYRHIISQRFRRHLESQGYQLSLTPLALVD